MTDCKHTEELNLQGKRLAVIGGHTIREEINICSKKYGFDVILYTFSKTSVRDILFGIMNVSIPQVTKYLLKVNKVDGVLLISAEKIIKRNIPWLNRSTYIFYTSENQWNTLMNKRSFGEYASNFGLPAIPEYHYDPSTFELKEEAEFPIVIKPIDKCGSSGISICKNSSELKEALSSRLSNSRKDQLLCQKYLNGPYFQFEIWMQNGKAFFPYVKDRVFYPSFGNCPPQPFIDLYPSVNQELISSCLFGKIEKLMTSLHVENGSCMFQGIIDHEIPYIMDTAFRVSGGLDFKVVRREKNVDLIEAHILYSLANRFGNDFSSLEEPYKRAYAIVCIGLRNGIISNIEGLDEIRNKPFVFDLFQHYKIGHRVTTSGLFSQTGLRIFLTDNSREELLDDVREIISILRIQDEQGNSMLLDYPEF